MTSQASKMWFNKKGQLHREDGPAVEWAVGNQHTKNQWHINGVEFSKEAFDRQIEKLNLEKELIIYINTFGEPFFKSKDNLYNVSVETGDTEIVSDSIEDDYWTGCSLRKEWGKTHGQVGEFHFLVPIIPFTLGGDFNVKNLMKLDIKQALEHYGNIRKKIHNLPDGTQIDIQVKP